MGNDGWDQLTTVRLILASIVVVGHAFGIFAYPFGFISESGMAVFGYAAVFAVVSFFLISGLVIGRSLIRRSSDGDAMFIGFMKGRFLRIYPPLMFSVALAAVIGLLLHYAGADRYEGPATALMRDRYSYLENLPGVITALVTFGFRGGITGSSNGPLWSLALEMQAYVFVGLAAQIIVAKGLWLKALSAVALIAALRLRGLQGLELYHFACFGAFAVGVALSFLPLRFPKILPVVQLDYSYSLYILHFPLMLAIFFLDCQGQPPSAGYVAFLIALSVLTSILVSMLSGILFERRAWMKRILTTPSAV